MQNSYNSYPVTALLKDLHWLRVPQRVQYKLCVLVHRCLNGTAPRYMTDLTVSIGSTHCPVVVCARRLLPTLSCQPHVARLSATERSPSLVREPGTVYRLLFARPLHRTVSLKTTEIIPVWTIFLSVTTCLLTLLGLL